MRLPGSSHSLSRGRVGEEGPTLHPNTCPTLHPNTCPTLHPNTCTCRCVLACPSVQTRAPLHPMCAALDCHVTPRPTRPLSEVSQPTSLNFTSLKPCRPEVHPLAPRVRSTTRSTLQWIAAALRYPDPLSPRPAPPAQTPPAPAGGAAGAAAGVYDRARDEWALDARELRGALERMDFGRATVSHEGGSC